MICSLVIEVIEADKVNLFLNSFKEVIINSESETNQNY